MTHISFDGLLVVAVIALGAPLLVSLAPKARIPADVVAIVAGFLISVAIGVIAGWIFHAIGYVRSPFLLAVVLSATSLGLVVPILKDAGQLDRDLGQLTVGGSSVADFGSVLLLSFFFLESSGSSSTKIVLIAGLGGTGRHRVGAVQAEPVHAARRRADPAAGHHGGDPGADHDRAGGRLCGGCGENRDGPDWPERREDQCGDRRGADLRGPAIGGGLPGRRADLLGTQRSPAPGDKVADRVAQGRPV